jgi:hypothetical protein
MTAFTASLQAYKSNAVKNGNEESANALLSLEMLIRAMESELRMWVALKDEAPSDAWRYLVDAQTASRSAVAAHTIGKKLNALNYLKRLVAFETLLFPPQGFTSIGASVKYAECSICGQEYGICDHLAGRPYWGQICVRNVVDASLNEISIVSEPDNKCCRITAIQDDEGLMRDTMTWRVVSVHGFDDKRARASIPEHGSSEREETN